jgi:hypothetical protein
MDKSNTEVSDNLLTEEEYLAKYKFTRKEYEEAAFGKEYVDTKYSDDLLTDEDYLAKYKITRKQVDTATIRKEYGKECVGDGVWIYIEK